MEKNLFISSFNRLPKSFLTALSIIILLEGMIMYLDNHFILFEYGNTMKLKNKYAQSNGQDYSILILGDCYFVTGINPQIIKEKTNLSAFNFSVGADPSILLPYIYFTHYLKDCVKKPKYIIVGYLPQFIFYNKEYIRKLFLPYFYYFRKGNIGILMKEFGFVESFKFLIPSLGYQELLQKGKFLKDFSAKPQKQDDRLKEIIEKGGFTPLAGDRIYKEHKEYKVYPYVTFNESLIFQKYFDKILKRAYEANIKVIYLIPTVPPDWYAVYEKTGIVKQNFEHLYAWQKKYPNFIILDLQKKLNTKEIYADRIHLNPIGANKLSYLIAEEINKINVK